MRHTLVWRMRITHDGQLISEHRLHRRPTADQLAYIRARDPICRFPVCRRPAHQCQTDHIRDWTERGITHEDNLQTACARHNLAKTPDATTTRATGPPTASTTACSGPAPAATPTPPGSTAENSSHTNAHSSNASSTPAKPVTCSAGGTDPEFSLEATSRMW